MRFIVKNFGPITYADVTLGNFTVFIGPGGTGKSYLAYLIWMLQEMEPDWSTLSLNLLSSQEFTNIFIKIQEGKEITEEESKHLLLKVMEIAEEAHKRKIGEYFKETFRVSNVGDLVCGESQRAEIEICNDKCTKKIKIEISKDNRISIKGFRELLEGERFAIKYLKDKRKIVFSHYDKELNWESIPIDADEGRIIDALNKIVITAIPLILIETLDDFMTAKLDYTNLILTDSKSGFLRFAPNLIRYSLVREEGLSISLPDRKMLSQLIIEKKEIKDEELNKIADFLEEKIEGKIDIKTMGLLFPEIFFKKGNITIPILRAHSGVRELSPLIIYLRYVFKREHDLSFITIEEPETHLHPYLQSIVTRVLAMLSNYVKVLITTHSSIILDELNNLIKLNKLNLEEKEELGYRGSEGLNWKSLKIYRFKLDGSVEEVKITEEGIEEEEFSSVVVELSNRYAEVEEFLWRKLHGQEK